MTAEIRPYRPSDADAVADVCIRTADAGGDASSLYPDPSILPTIFAEPYLAFEPELGFVVDNGERAVGYILGTSDTPEFVRRFRNEWLPKVADRFPLRASSDQMTRLLHDPERLLWPELVPYPAHLHIDLLPEYQHSGFGRALIACFLAALAARGVPAVHLGMVNANVKARAFYDRLGFHVIPVPDPSPLTYLGLSVDSAIA